MWDASRQPGPGFRGHPGEQFPPRIPQGAHPRMRGRPPFPFREGPRVANPHFGGPGVAPFLHRDMPIDGCWEEGRMLPEEQRPLPRRPRMSMNYRAMAFREEEMTDIHYGEMAGPESEFLRARLAPDMDYRGIPDVDYRHDEGAAIAYRERLPPPPIFRERESLDYRRRMLAEMELREREALEQQRQRISTMLDYSEREMEELEYKHRLDALQEIVLRQRESSELLCRDREQMLRERSTLEYNERAAPTHFRESTDLDLRFSKPDVTFMDQERGMDFRDRMVIDYSHHEDKTLQGKAPGPEYMEVDYNTSEKLPSDAKAAAGVARRSLETTRAPNATYKKRDVEIPGISSDTDYREKESTDSDYREKETSDSDYRDNTDSDYRDMEAIDSDYWGKKSSDSDYREKESADADYRKTADNGMKKSADTKETEGSDAKLVKNRKDLKSVISAPAPLPKSEQRIPFLSYGEPKISSVSKVKNEDLRQEGALSAAKRAGQSEADKCAYPGKSDVDFRDRPKTEDQKNKEVPSKVSGYSADSKELCSSDQDMRSKDFSKKSAPSGGDQDFRTGKYLQKKDEDLRAEKEQASTNVLAQSAVLYDFIKLAAKELKQQEKGGVRAEAGGRAAAHTPEKPPMAKTSPSASGTSKAAGGPSPGVEFLGRQDADYRNKDYNDVDLRVGRGPDKKSPEDLQPGSKDKDYRRTTIPDGATRIIWLDGLPTGASREDILSALSAAAPLPDHGVNLIGYIPGYSFGSVCVEFSLVEEAVGCMEANKGVLHFRGKKVGLNYIPNSDRWNCQQCKVVNVLSKERCWQCSALRAGSDHLPVRDALKDAKTPAFLTSRRAKKRKAKPIPSAHSPDNRTNKSPLPKANKGGKPAESESATVIIRGIGANTTPECVVKALRPYVQLSVRKVRIMKNRKSDHRGFGFIDLKNHKEAIRLTVLVRELKPPLTIDGKPITVDLAVGERKSEQGKSQKGNKSSSGKNRNRRAQRRSIAYPGFKASVDDGPSYVYDPKSGLYVDPLTDTYYDGTKTQRQKSDCQYQSPGSEKTEPSGQPRRGFTEVNDSEEDPFKRPLPPLVAKKEDPPPEPKPNPLIKLLGEYGDDSEEEEDQELLPPVKKKPPPPPPPAPKPAPLPAPPTPSPASTYEDKLTDWKKMVCLLCRRQFPSKEALIRHQKLSDLHKQNLAIQDKIRKSQKELAYLQQKEQEENQSIQRRLLQARRELEMLERQEESAQQESEGLDSELRGPGKKRGSDTSSEHKAKVKKQTGESYRENMKRRILERYKELE